MSAPAGPYRPTPALYRMRAMIDAMRILLPIQLTAAGLIGFIGLMVLAWMHLPLWAALMSVPSMPQDIRSSADGRKFYVADMKEDGVFVVDPVKLERIGFIQTGIGTHGIYPSRDGTKLYVTNRGWNTILARWTR